MAKIKAHQDIILATHPIGTVVCNSENKAPFDVGTWLMVDKEFQPLSTGKVNEYITSNSEIISSYGIAIRRNGHSILINLSFSLSVDINITDIKRLFTMDFSKIGITNVMASCMRFTGLKIGYSGEPMGVIFLDLTKDGYITTHGAVGKITPTNKQPICVDFEIMSTPGEMLDECCNKFYFKRIA